MCFCEPDQPRHADTMKAVGGDESGDRKVAQ